MLTQTAQDWTRHSRKERRFMAMKRKAVRQTHTKKLAQMNTVASMRTRTLREQIGAITITSQATVVIITGRLGTILNIVKHKLKRNMAQLKILTGRIWRQKPRLLPINRGLATDKVPIPIPPSRQVPSHYRVPTDHPRNLFVLQKDDHVLRWRKERQRTPRIRLGFVPVQD